VEKYLTKIHLSNYMIPKVIGQTSIPIGTHIFTLEKEITNSRDYL
jgi:hypothetical protein